VTVDESTLPREVSDCIAAAVRGWELPRPPSPKAFILFEWQLDRATPEERAASERDEAFAVALETAPLPKGARVTRDLGTDEAGPPKGKPIAKPLPPKASPPPEPTGEETGGKEAVPQVPPPSETADLSTAPPMKGKKKLSKAPPPDEVDVKKTEEKTGDVDHLGVVKARLAELTAELDKGTLTPEDYQARAVQAVDDELSKLGKPMDKKQMYEQSQLVRLRKQVLGRK
jgi:hypothetical protein